MFNVLTRSVVQAGATCPPLWKSRRYIDWTHSPAVYVATVQPLREHAASSNR